MRIRLTFPGTAPSANHQYRRRAGGLQLARTDDATTYYNEVVLRTREARPSGFAPTGQIRLFFDFYLNRHVDADNMLKILDDAIATGLGVNDRHFLPCVRSIVHKVPWREARTEVEILWHQNVPSE